MKAWFPEEEDEKVKRTLVCIGGIVDARCTAPGGGSRPVIGGAHSLQMLALRHYQQNRVAIRFRRLGADLQFIQQAVENPFGRLPLALDSPEAGWKFGTFGWAQGRLFY